MYPNDRPVSDNPVESSEGLDFEKYYLIFRGRIWLILGCIAIAALATGLYLQRAPKVYAAESIIKVDLQQPRIQGIPNVFEEDRRTPEGASEKSREIEQLLKNRQFFLRAIEAKRLEADPRFETSATGTPEAKNAIASMLAGSVDVTLQKASGFLILSVEDSDPQLAADIANLLVDEVIRQDVESYSRFEKTSLAELEPRLRQATARLTNSETKLQQYKAQAAVLEGRQAAVTQNVRDLSQKVSEAKYARLRIESELTESQRLTNDVPALLKLATIREDPKVVAIRASITQKEIEIGNVKQRYKEKHPKFITSHDELRDLQQQLSNSTLAAVQSIRVAYTSAVANEKSVEKALEEQKTVAETLGRESVPYDSLVQEIVAERAMYDKLIAAVKAAKLEVQVNPSRIRVIQNAEVPTWPIKPIFARTVAIGLLAGLASGLALALGLSKLDSSFKSVEEVEQFVRHPVLAAVPHIKDLAAHQAAAIMDSDPGSIAAESFRTLRTSMSLIDRSADRRVILFTSAVAQEGKTLCALNYAVGLARQGLRTLLIDCDLRQPMVGRMLFPNEEHLTGVAECLQLPAIHAAETVTPVKKPPVSALSFAELRNKHQGARETTPERSPAAWDSPGKVSRSEVLAQFARPTQFENLHAIPGGRLVPNPTELLAQSGLNHLLTEALRRFDRVVLDSAPLCSVSDTQLLIPHTQAVCFVIRANRTPRKAVQRAMEVLTRGEAPVVGAILNGLTAGQISHYGDPYHSYGYSRPQPAESPKITSLG